MGGQLFATGNQGWGFGIFAVAAVFATAMLLVLSLVAAKGADRTKKDDNLTKQEQPLTV
jgi:hypothetical protein